MLKSTTLAAMVLLAGTAVGQNDDHDHDDDCMHATGVLVLNTSASDAATVSGQARVISDHFHVASSSGEAIVVNGRGRIECQEICIEGDYVLSGRHASIMGGIWTEFAVDHDPFEERANAIDWESYKPQDDGSGLDSAGAVHLSNGSHTLSPGYYPAGIKVSGADVHFEEGLYLIEGGFDVSSHSNLSGEGVTLAILSGDMNVSGQASFDIDAPDHGEFEELTIVFPRSNNGGDISLSGGADLNIQGVIYAPGGHMSVTGQATGAIRGPFVGEHVVVDTLELAGQGLIIIGKEGNLSIPMAPAHD